MTEATQKTLTDPLVLPCGISIKNRFLKSATSEQMGNVELNPTPGLAHLYKTWANGGAGLLISGNLMIDRTALGEPHNVALDERSDLETFRRWTRSGTHNNTQFWAQLNHPGRQAPIYLSKQPVAPSVIELEGSLAKAFATPRALTGAEVLELITKFASSAKLAKEAGFTGVQIHAAHGYLISQFLSPRTNKRDDEWGGTLENRMRFLLETFQAVRKQVGDDFPVAVKLNSAEFMEDGFNEDDSVEVVKSLVRAGVDLIEISGGSYESPAFAKDGKPVRDSTKKREAFFLDFAEKVKKVSTVPLAVTGGFRSRKGMDQAIQSNATDMVGMARAMILMPDLPTKVLTNNDFSLVWKEPSTGFRKIDTTAMLSLVWYEMQLHRLGKGQSPKMSLSPWTVALKSVWDIITLGSRKRRI